MRLGPGLADADQEAGGEGDGQLARRHRRVASRRSGVLSGAPRWQARSGSRDSIIIPWLADTARSRASSSGPRAPALAWGSRPVSSRTSAQAATR